jgi:hypothetical protein
MGGVVVVGERAATGVRPRSRRHPGPDPRGDAVVEIGRERRG